MKLILVVALTIDGKIGRTESHFPDWTGSADKRMFKSISSKAGVVIMGSKTFDTIGKPLPGRKNVILTRNEERTSPWENLVFTNDSPRQVVKNLEAEGYSEAVLAGGARINTLFAREALIDEMAITFSPVVFGKGVALFTEEMKMQFALMEYRVLDENTIWARYAVLK